MAMAPGPGPEPAEVVAERAELTRRAADLDARARARALDERERELLEREASVDARAVLQGLDRVEPAWSLPAAPVATELRHLMIDTGDDLPTVARGIGLDPDWARGVLTGDVVDVDVAHVQQVCEGLHCTPYDLFGPELARSIAHAYGPDLWPAGVQPLEPVGWSPDDFDPDVAGPRPSAHPAEPPGVELDLGLEP